MINFKIKGDYKKANEYFQRMLEIAKRSDLDRYGREGVEALAAATPVHTGETASSWYYNISHANGKTTISFKNSHIVDGCPIAIILQYGHATRNGGYVEGRDYINPAIQPIFDKLADEAWKEVTKR